ncbi:HD domain-containing protein [Leminorella grimontii]|uniref:HD domain-containing protein n=1 Tax=Leminorella grimontii TaxID=82981 RepID=UPI00208ADB98|nr:HD domain-containing protein [Leminorella grimontii]GKX61296.1 hypothetical protein SOASR031_36110 [Leminorella grimontii]
MSDLEKRAREFATRIHAEANQRRKYTLAPYIVHPAAVAELVRSVPHTPEMLAAAWLHDTVEDTDVCIDDIFRLFGESVAQYVAMVTKVSVERDGDREARFLIDLRHTALACPQAKTIKLADIIDNCRTVADFDPAFAEGYLGEKRRQVAVLTQGNTMLFQQANETIARGIEVVRVWKRSRRPF